MDIGLRRSYGGDDSLPTERTISWEAMERVIQQAEAMAKKAADEAACWAFIRAYRQAVNDPEAAGLEAYDAAYDPAYEEALDEEYDRAFDAAWEKEGRWAPPSRRRCIGSPGSLEVAE